MYYGGLTNTSMEIEFTGEFFVPGQGSVISEEEHFERYKFASGFAQGKRVLDIACGVGYGSRILIEAKASSVLGCDILEENIKYATHKYRKGNLDFKVKDATKPISEGKFDLIVSFETIEHIKDFEPVLENFYDSLHEQGKLIISSPNRNITNPYLEPNDRLKGYHFREFTIGEFRDHLLQKGFKNIELYGQRQQRVFQSPFLEKHYKRIFKPSAKSSPKVEPIKDGLEPEYFVMVCGK